MRVATKLEMRFLEITALKIKDIVRHIKIIADMTP